MRAARRTIEHCRGVALAMLLATAALGMPAGAGADDDHDRWHGRDRHDEWHGDRHGDGHHRDRHDDDRDWDRHDDDHDGEWERHRHDARRFAPNVEVIVDGLHLGDRERPAEEGAGDDAGVTICHQAGGTVWSTRELPCEQPTPPERSKVWSTSP